MSDQLMDAGLRSAQDQLRKLLASPAGTGRPGRSALIRAGLLVAVEAIDKVRAHLDDDESDEEHAVYAIVAASVAADLALPEPAVAGAVLELCGDPANDVSAATPAKADPAVVEAVRAWLLRVTVHYTLPKSGPVTRTVQLYYGADETGARSREVRDEISRDDVPEDARERAIRRGIEEATYQIYPRRA
ncbi:hypothetical protein [Actinoplanes sp. GCM10030250]|uniref:hypothetical protein n=1 Tax=Actinoplanes sp. GCM10030250 TaxID=3273376 RepID=UPI00361AE363